MSHKVRRLVSFFPPLFKRKTERCSFKSVTVKNMNFNDLKDDP